MTPIGNDIVDLSEHKARQRRALEATCSPTERSRILNSHEPALAFAETWCVKEAVFKALQGRYSAMRFEPETLVTIFAGDAIETTEVRPRYKCAGLFVECTRAEQYVHAVAAYSEKGLATTIFAIREGTGWKNESDEARNLLRDLLRHLGCKSYELRHPRGRVPVVLGDNGTPLCRASLSHDGVWRAVAVSLR